ncbi:MAG: radical SAM protein [Halobacteriota archaeon]|nr:radical SAM protein [Halobacteriota archaeon]
MALKMDLHPDCPKPKELISQIHLLDNCNLSCKHCYVGDSRFKPRNRPSTEELKRRIKLMVDFSNELGFEEHTMNISGGEPTLRKDLFDLVYFIKSEGAYPHLLTNGLKLSKEYTSKLVESGCGGLQISLEGTKTENDLLRGEGSYGKAVKGLKNARELGLRVTVGVTISNGNVETIFDLFEELDGKVNKFHVRELTPIGAGSLLISPSSKQRKVFYEKVYDWEGSTRIFIEDPPYCTIASDLPDERAGCAACICLFCVDVDGSVYPCRKAPVKIGHVDDLEAAWNSKTAVRIRNRDYNGRCGSCEIKWSCGGCRGFASATTGDILGSDDRCFL